mmetsp:Transcript_48229/g.113359  ORF Transcript_48229/g.113359 Transcript_48229/m.113359 type:complete len:224 (+) Transcript_48229:23-694(+)
MLVRVDLPREYDDGSKSSISFRIQIWVEESEPPRSVSRRSYDDFVTLRRLVLQEDPVLHLARLPKRPPQPDECAILLQEWLTATTSAATNDEAFTKFLEASYEQWISFVTKKQGSVTSHWDELESILTDEPQVQDRERIVEQEEAFKECFARASTFAGTLAIFRAWVQSRVDECETMPQSNRAQVNAHVNQLQHHLKKVMEYLSASEHAWRASVDDQQEGTTG